jgi:hypothetical protein
MFMEALGRLFDVGLGFAPVDLNTAGATGKRLNMSKGSGVTILLGVGVAASGVEDLVLTLKQHTAYTSGTTSNLATCDHYYLKSEALLDNDESWVKVSQTASQTITVAGATYAASQLLVAIEVGADQLSDGYAWVSLDAADPGSAARLAFSAYILHDLSTQRAPANMGNLLRPGAANA